MTERFENYSKRVKEEVRKYFDENSIEICFTLKECILKEDFEGGTSVEASARLFIEELLEDW